MQIFFFATDEREEVAAIFLKTATRYLLQNNLYNNLYSCSSLG